jgi:2-polyprenyl-6-methoxyphenol hydroxylase-like FAD-dependent oxidoreductase
LTIYIANAARRQRPGRHPGHRGKVAKTVDGPGGLDAYDRLRRTRTQKIALRSHRIGVAAQWASPTAVTLRNTALRLLPGSSFVRSLGPVLDWTA